MPSLELKKKDKYLGKGFWKEVHARGGYVKPLPVWFLHQKKLFRIWSIKNHILFANLPLRRTVLTWMRIYKSLGEIDSNRLRLRDEFDRKDYKMIIYAAKIPFDVWIYIFTFFRHSWATI